MQNFANPGFILVAGLGLFGLSACGLNSQVKVTTRVGNCAAGSIEASCAAQSSTLLSLTGRRPLAIKSGDTVTLTGTGFNKAMSATIGGIPVTSLDVTSATAASLVVPPGIKTGMSDLKLALTAAEATASVAYSPADGIPLMTVAASEVCSGVEFYDLNGDKQTGTKSCSGSLPPDAWDLRAGTTVGGVTGQLKVNCRNAVRLSGTSGVFDNTTYPAAAGSDIWDTIDDYYGLPAFADFPSSWSVANNYCGGVDDPNSSSDDDNVWRDVTTTNGTTASTCEATTANCTMQDKISGLKWSELASSSATWQEAVTTCVGLTHNGQTAGSWRLPTQKELMDAFNHGISSAARTDVHWMTILDMQRVFWSSSSSALTTSNAWNVVLAHGDAYISGKNSGLAVVCVQ